MRKQNIYIVLTLFILVSLQMSVGVFAQCGTYATDGDEVTDCSGIIICCEAPGACNGPGTACHNYDPDYAATGGCDLSCVAPGCTDAQAPNFDPEANTDDGSCDFPPANFTFTPTSGSGLFIAQVTLDNVTADAADWIGAFDSDGNCAGASQLLINEGVAYAQLVIYADDGTTADLDEGMSSNESFTLQLFDAFSSSYFTYYNEIGETDLYGWSNTNGAPMPGFDDAEEVYAFESEPYTPNCLDAAACNYDVNSQSSTGCIYPETGYNCDGECLADEDEDGICDPFEIAGCTDVTACNYVTSPTDLVECTYPEAGYDCLSQCIQDDDEDGVCNEFEVEGCTDSNACNYVGAATEDDGSCEYPTGFYDCEGDCLNDQDGDLVCDEEEIAGCTVSNACNFDPGATDDDGGCQFPLEGYDCEGICILDLDEDGVCDVTDSCVGFIDACGICNGPGAIYACGCSEMLAGACDCDGNQLDVLGVCGGSCQSDADTDGVCDSDEVNGCTDPDGCNFDEANTEEDGSCTYAEAALDCDGNCLIDLDDDGVCDQFELFGCDDEGALNYNPSVTENDGSCLFPSDPPFNFAFTVTPSSGTIIGQIQIDGNAATQYDWIAAFDSDGNCAGAGVLIEYEGVAYMNMTVYGDDATTPTVDEGITGEEPFSLVVWDESELTTIPYFENGVIVEFSGWTNTNGAPIPGYADASVVYDFNLDNADPNCGDPQACNFNVESTSDTGCTYAVWGYNCDGACLADTDGDGICNPFEVSGCTAQAACNYEAEATDDDGSCTFAAFGYDCDGECLVDSDEDGICDALELPGCMEDDACNYNSSATDEDGSCFYAQTHYDCEGQCIEDADEDGVCDPFEIVGCTEQNACNFDATATDDDGQCQYPSTYEDCVGNCLNDSNNNGTCDELEGCTDSSACNFEAENTLDDGSCEYASFGYDCSGTCLSDADQDGVCDVLEVPGCTYPSACNYNSSATDDDGSCTFVPIGFDCELNCLFDQDGDGVCDADEIPGCTDETALNYTPLATEEDGSCTYEPCPSDLDGDGYINIGDVLLLLTDYGNECNENE